MHFQSLKSECKTLCNHFAVEPYKLIGSRLGHTVAVGEIKLQQFQSSYFNSIHVNSLSSQEHHYGKAGGEINVTFTSLKHQTSETQDDFEFLSKRTISERLRENLENGNKF